MATTKAIPWTNQHDDFCYENRIPPAAQFLWRWLMTEGKLGTDIYPDLTEFNERVARERGKPYTRQTLKDAFKKLVDCRVITVIRQFCWKISQIVVRPLEWLQPQKNLHSRKKISYSCPSNPDSVVDEELEQPQPNTHAQQVDALCQHYGLDFDTTCNAFKEILTYSWNDIGWALEYLVDQLSRNPLKKAAEGYLLQVLRKGWHRRNWLYGVPNYLSPVELNELKPP